MSAPLDAAVASEPVAPEPVFEIVGASGRRHAAVPALEFDVHVSEPDGRRVYLIALAAQIMIEPARRRYEAGTHAALVELFGPAERWSVTTRSLMWHRADVLVSTFTGSTTFRIPVPCSYDLELAAAKYFYSLPDGEVPLAFNFNGTVFYEEGGRLQMSLVPWSCSAEFRLPIATWRELIEHYYPRATWVSLHRDTLARLEAEKRRRRLPTLDAAVARLLEQQ